MKEPIRWLDDPGTSSNLRRVLEADHQAPKMPQQTQAKLAALAAGLVVHGAALPAAAAGSWASSVAAWLGIGGTGKAVALVTLMGALGSGSYLVTRQLQDRSVPVPVPVASERASVQSPPAVALSSSSLPAHAVEPMRPPLAEIGSKSGPVGPSRARGIGSAGAETRPEPAHSRGTAAFEELSIADEARLLEQARASLVTQPSRALAIASSHQKTYPAGQLSAERELIIVDALLRLGRRQEAEQRAAPQLRESGDTLYGRRLRALLASKNAQ